MDATKLQTTLHNLLLDPTYHAPLTLLKALRNGLVYGTKVRLPHALVMIFLFRSGSTAEKLRLVFKATRLHARNLALFALIYKASLLALRGLAPNRKEHSAHSFIAGLAGGYYVFGRYKSSVSQQIVIYVFARVLLALAKLAIESPGDNTLVGARYGGRGGMGFLGDAIGLSPEGRVKLERAAWPVFASLSWAAVMWLFRWYPEMLQASMRSSMVYIYDNADHWDSWRNFLWHNK